MEVNSSSTVVERAAAERFGGNVSVDAPSVALVVRSLKFILGWLGWRKRLRVNGMLERAFGGEEMMCDAETSWSHVVASTTRRRVYALEEIWLADNSALLLDAVRKTASLDIVAPRLDVPIEVKQFVRALLADLQDREARRQLDERRALVVVDEPQQYTNYDKHLCSFRDETLELMLRAIESCYSEITDECVLYDDERDPPLLSVNYKIIVPCRIPVGGDYTGKTVDHQQYVDVGLDLNRHSPSEFFRRFFHQLFGEVPLTAGDSENPEARTVRVFRVKLDAGGGLTLCDILVRSGTFVHNLIPRLQLSTLLRVNYESIQAKSILVAGVLSPRDVIANLTSNQLKEQTYHDLRDVRSALVRAARVEVVAHYRLAYRRSQVSPSAEPGTESVVTEPNDERAQITRTLQRMGVRDRGNWFPPIGLESCSSLLVAVSRLRATDEAIDVNRLSLNRVTWFPDLSRLARSIVDKSTFETEQEKFVLLATSVLFDVDTLIEVCRVPASGAFLRHARHRGLGMLLLPADCSPTVDRTLGVVAGCDRVDVATAVFGSRGAMFRNNSDLGRRGRLPDVQSRGGNQHLRRFRLCVLFADENVREYYTAATPLGLVGLVSDLVGHLFPSKTDAEFVLSPVNSLSVQAATNEVDAKVRWHLARVLSFDPFQAQVCAPVTDPIISPLFKLLRETGDHASKRIIVSGAKLWQLLRPIPPAGRCLAYVRSVATLYSPKCTDRLVSQTVCGMLPVSLTSDTDTWKSYRYLHPSASSASSLSSESGCSCIVIDRSRNGDNLVAVSCSQAFGSIRAAARGSNASVSLVCVGDRYSHDWTVYVFTERGSFEQFNRAYVSDQNAVSIAADSLPLSPVRSATAVALLGWYLDHYSYTDKRAPRIAKVISKRVYTVNGVLAFCEQLTKVVSVAPERIDHVGRGYVARPCNFADYGVVTAQPRRPNDEEDICFEREISAVSDAISVPSKLHFYHRVYVPMRATNRNGVNVSCTMRQLSSGAAYVVTLGETRLWFPSVRLVEQQRRTAQQCYSGVPDAIVPLMEHYAAQAATTAT